MFGRTAIACAIGVAASTAMLASPAAAVEVSATVTSGTTQASPTQVDRLTIGEYVDRLRGEPTRGIGLTYRYVPVESSVVNRFHREGSVVLDSSGAALSKYASGSWPGSPVAETKVFADYSYLRNGVPPLDGVAWRSMITPRGLGPKEAVEDLILYFTGSDNYPSYSIGTVAGNTITWTGQVDRGPDSRPGTLTTVCQMSPTPSQPLCEISLDGQLNAVVDFAYSDESIARPVLPRMLPVDYNPKTNQFTTTASLASASKRFLPSLAALRKSFGRPQLRSGPTNYENNAALLSEYYIVPKAPGKTTAQVTFVSTRDMDMYVRARTGADARWRFDAKRKAIVVRDAYANTYVWVAHRGSLVEVKAANQATAFKVVSLLG